MPLRFRNYPIIWDTIRNHGFRQLPRSLSNSGSQLSRQRWGLSLFRGREVTIVELYGAIYDTLPQHLAEQFKSLDISYGTRVALRSGQTFQFPPNTEVSAIVARIVEETR